MEKIILPLVRLKKCIEKPDVYIFIDIDENVYIAAKQSVVYDVCTVTFTLAPGNRR